MGKIVWTEKASAHLKAIHDYIAEDSSVYAIRFTKSLVTSRKFTEVPSNSGTERPERACVLHEFSTGAQGKGIAEELNNLKLY